MGSLSSLVSDSRRRSRWPGSGPRPGALLGLFLLGLGVGTGTLATPKDAITRLVDPLAPGPDLPPLGRSVFDELFLVPKAENGLSYRLPYPFTRLLSRIDRELPKDRRGNSSLKTVLIPLGRSNQRDDAAPDFFASPRVIVAVDTEPDVATLERPYLLKDRLFIAYQPRASSLQVTSYNERLGRFEFQTVSNYGEGGKPVVRYASRRRCLSCHQNAGPIFSRPPWEETNRNPEIAQRLGREGTTFHGIPVNPQSAEPGAIDRATERANLFSAFQRLWAEGCGVGKAAIDCRAGALDAMLQYRLGAFAHIDTRSELFWDRFVPTAAGGWQRRWGKGLAIPEPDIPNRSPLDATYTGEMHVAQDPLTLRPPRAVWTVSDLGRLIRGMSELIPRADIRRLDQRVYERGQIESGWRWRFRGPCVFKNRGSLGGGHLLGLECQMLGGALGRAFDLATDLLVESGRVTSRAVNSLQLSDGTRFSGLIHAGGAIRSSADHFHFELRVVQQRNGLHAWLPDGSAVESIEIRWPRSPAGRAELPPELVFQGKAVLTLVPGFETIPEAVSRLAARARSRGSGALTEAAFRPTELMRELFVELGLPPTRWCCAPLPSAAEGHPASGEHGGEAQRTEGSR